MLALTRRKDESIIINGNIEVQVLSVQGDKVKLGISAPKEVAVYRKEVYVQIQEANKEALSAKHMNINGLYQLMKKNEKN